MYLELTYNIDKRSWTTRDHNGNLFVLANRFSREHEGLADAFESKEGKLVRKHFCGRWMIVSRLGSHPRGFLIAPADDLVLVEHLGFSVENNVTTAKVSWAKDKNGNTIPGYAGATISPGHVQQLLKIGTPEDAQGGQVYVVKGEYRASGIALVEDVAPAC